MCVMFAGISLFVLLSLKTEKSQKLQNFSCLPLVFKHLEKSLTYERGSEKYINKCTDERLLVNNK